MKFEPLLLLLLGAFATGFVGWRFRVREARDAVHIKDLRSKVDSITDELNDIEDLSFNYFLKAGNDQSVQQDGLKIKAKIQRVGTLVNAVHRDVNMGADRRNFSLLTKLKNLRQAVTLEDFDSAEREAWNANDPRFARITRCAADLNEALESAYASEKSR